MQMTKEVKGSKASGKVFQDGMDRLSNFLMEKGTWYIKEDDKRDFQVSYDVWIGWQKVDPFVVKYAWKDVEEYCNREDTDIHIYQAEYGSVHMYWKAI